MIIPSIDLRDGHAVQLIQGDVQALDAGDPRPLAEQFGRVGEVAVIDLDAAMGRGSSAHVLRELLPLARCRVGGGIRTAEQALDWLDAGAERVILGTAARPEILAEILKKAPRDRVIAALDARDGEVVVEGWQRRTGERVEDRIAELTPYVGGFLLTFVEREGCLQGTDVDRAAKLQALAGDARVTIAGGITQPEEIARLDRDGMDAQVGMALYRGRFDLADALAACMTSDRSDGLWPTVVTDELGVALGLAWSDEASLREALASGRGVYRSRRRGLWKKGETSGATQELLAVDLDCDRDALRFTVRQNAPGFCHRDTRTCWGSDGQDTGLGALVRTLERRRDDGAPGSYTRRLLADSPLLRAKLLEEAQELVEANGPAEVIHEAADVLYFTLVRAVASGVGLEQITAELDARARRVRRRSEAKS